MIRRLYLAPVFLAVALMSGCAARVSYRTYDPYYHDYHVWTDAEGPYYNSWIVGNTSAKRGVQAPAASGPAGVLALAARSSVIARGAIQDPPGGNGPKKKGRTSVRPLFFRYLNS